ncbi:hypothetical protein NCU06069 [Neurospora crassa OR74A]|uniref:Uncharacterized protein n=2 Tax=Neurospora crassa (strain ATCC 24698 / 74-OR23-1A / CBS 708.71 / DSM 1257 / FGSC 987) TaxID=367110 RepID=V5IMG1_NEUCR|nr:hypothetical protein NCU06069 [Neurospora crassa OR74A]ESA41921.1 hypothetical protein NCU06069 [Neurospora crassa OR74A]|eukprot:XP_011395226.1 hypothetical protein NCU06069 [Neurospora crassa OR74A]
MGLQGPDSTFSITNPGQTQGFLELPQTFTKSSFLRGNKTKKSDCYLAIETRQDTMFLSTKMNAFTPSSLAQRSRLLLRNAHASPALGTPRISRQSYTTGQKPAGKSGNFKATGEQPKRVDPNSPEYKAYQRTWTTVMIGTPIILVCSYELWQRLIEGKKPLSLEPKDTTALTELTPHSENPSTRA